MKNIPAQGYGTSGGDIPSEGIGGFSVLHANLPQYSINNLGDPGNLWITEPDMSHYIWVQLADYYPIKRFVLAGTVSDVVPDGTLYLTIAAYTTQPSTGLPPDADSWTLSYIFDPIAITIASGSGTLSATLDMPIPIVTNCIKLTFSAATSFTLNLNTYQMFGFQESSWPLYIRTRISPTAPTKQREVSLAITATVG